MTGLLETIFAPGSVDVMLNIGMIVLRIAIVLGIVLLHVAYAPYFERKTIGHMQVRMGPMRVGPHGLLQPIADGLKLFFKEDIIPDQADKSIFYISPLISMFAAMSTLAVIPFSQGFVISNINIGLLFVLAMSSLGAYGVVMSGWSSNSKYAFLGGLRSSAQVISYEIAMGLSLVGVIIMAGSLNLSDIVKAQEAYPLKSFVVPQIIGFFVFCVAAVAETNRTPFDLAEAESELVAGYFTEYSGIRFALFFLAEYIGMILMAAIAALCFLGGWHGPFEVPYVPFFWLALKIYFFMFVYFWVRATVPRYRYDQLMGLGWKLMIPLALFNVVLTGTIKMLR
ncbi:MAG: NADH-quinone oxidoreductase subunit NuoH [Nitrospirota bacterium]